MLVLASKLNYGNAVPVMVFGQSKRKSEGGVVSATSSSFFFAKNFDFFCENANFIRRLNLK